MHMTNITVKSCIRVKIDGNQGFFFNHPSSYPKNLDTLGGNAAYQVKVTLKYFKFHKHSGLQKLWEENVPSTD